MADADEDVIPRSTYPSLSSANANSDPTIDLEDEAQDFRFLANLTSKHFGASALPKRGEKDFEPNPTQAQSNTLAASREAMHTALSVERVMLPQNPLVGQYLNDPKDWRWDVSPEATHSGKGIGGRCVVVEKFRTTYSRNIGVSDHRNWTWLLPEEALFLLERGTLDVRWPDERTWGVTEGYGGISSDVVEQDEQESDGGSEDEKSEDESEPAAEEQNVTIIVEDAARNEDELGKNKKTKKSPQYAPLEAGVMPMSLQGAYATFIGKSGLTLERYNVYTHLRRLGYVLQRAPTWDDNDNDNEDQETHDHYTNGHVSESDGHMTTPLLSNLDTASVSSSERNSLLHPNPATTLINRLVGFLTAPKQLHHNAAQGPLIYPGLYSNYSDIFRTLSLIPYHHQQQPISPTIATTATPKPPYTIAFHAFKPTTPFRKSSPPEPDFRICVLDARSTSIPSALEIGHLIDAMPDDQLPKEKKMETRMKHGMRHVILAVVDSGLVSYLRLADVCSGIQGRLFETKGARGGGGKRGGGAWKKRGGGAGGGSRR